MGPVARERGAGSRGRNPAGGKTTPRGALPLAWSPGAGLELFNSGLEILEDLPAFLALELVVRALHRSPGPGRAAVHLSGDLGWKESESRSQRRLPWRLLGNQRGARIQGLAALPGARGPLGGL